MKRSGAVETFTFEGTPINRETPETERAAIAGFAEWFLGINPDTGESAIVDESLDDRLDPGAFTPGLAEVNGRANGFVALTAGPDGADPTITLLERCE